MGDSSRKGSKSPKSPKSPTSPGRGSKATPPPAASGSPGPTSPQSAASPPGNVGALEADDEDEGESDADSLFSSATGVSDTTSVTSSIFRFREENGRTYHAYRAREAAYFLPNDEKENERLDLQHNLFLLSQDNQLFLSPAGRDKPLNRVLDAGTGTGIWAIELADEHPNTSVVGIDLSPIQPSFVPPNAEFFVDDLENNWTFMTKFDLVYARMLTGSIKNWPRFIEQAYQHVQPGGYIELADVLPLTSDDGTFAEDSPLAQWSRYLVEASEKHGASMRSAEHYKQQLLDAGFQDVVQVDFKWPINPWAKDARHKEIGAWTSENILSGIQGISLMLFTNILGWSTSEVETFLVGVRKDLKDRNIHAYWPLVIVYGRKPE